MRSWIVASICTLGLGFLTHSHGDVYQYFIATSVFAIFLKMSNYP